MGKPVGWVQFEVLENFIDCLFFFKLQEKKSFDYLVIIYIQFTKFQFFCTLFQLFALFGINWCALSCLEVFIYIV